MRRRKKENPLQTEFEEIDGVFYMPLPCVFTMTRAELFEFLPTATPRWLRAAVLALAWDKL